MSLAQQIRTICISPDGSLLLSIDEDGRSLLINKVWGGAMVEHDMQMFRDPNQQIGP